MMNPRPVIAKVADATGTVRSSLDALEQLLSVLHDDNVVTVAEAREVHELAQRLAADAQAAVKATASITYHVLLQRQDVA